MFSGSILRILAVGFIFLNASTALGQDYPTKPVRIVTGQVGGTPDSALRFLGPDISTAWGQPVVIDNRGGAIPYEIVSKSPPDGYTLLLDGGSFWIAPLLQSVPYDVVKDFAPITSTFSAPNILVVHVSTPATTVKELIALAKAKPGVLNYATGGTGSSSHLAGELFKVMAGVDIVRIAYKGAPQATAALLAGDEVQMQFGPPSTSIVNIKAGKLRALAVTSAEPSALAPGIITMAAAGLPGYVSGTGYGVFAPARTPAAILNRINQEFVRALNRQGMKDQLLNVGSEVTVSRSPAEFDAFVKGEMSKWGKLIKEAGIKVD